VPQIIRILKPIVYRVRTSCPVRWLAVAGCLLGVCLLSFSSILADGVGGTTRVIELDDEGGGGQRAWVDWTGRQASSWVEFDNVGLVVGTTISNTFALEVVDLDGDGDLDLVSAGESGDIIAWQNHGTPFGGGWTAHRLGTAYLPVGLAAGDLDGDEDSDLAVAQVHGPTIWQNDGTPFEGEWSSRQIGDRTVGAVKIADVTGDGRPDVITGGGLPWWGEPNDSNWVTVWHGPESPFSQSWSAADVDLAYYTVLGLDVGDLDNDGDKDIVIGTDHAPPVGSVDNPVPPEDWPAVYQVRAFRNDGGNHWTALNVGRDPEIETLAYVAYHGFWGASVNHVALADLDSDGDLDIIATEGVEGDFLVMGWQNDGTPFSGELWAPSAIAKGEVHNWLEDSVLWAETIDFDRDGDLDIVSGSRAVLEPWPLNLWENTGIAFGAVISETHWLRHSISSRREDIWTVRVADFDQDGDLDLATAAHALRAGESSAIRVWENASFSLDVTPTAQTGAPGAVITYSVTALAWHGFNQPIALWVSGLPVGVEATWQHSPLLPGGATVLTLTTSPNSLERDYSMGVVGVGARFVRSASFTLTLTSQEYQTYLPLVLRDE